MNTYLCPKTYKLVREEYPWSVQPVWYHGIYMVQDRPWAAGTYRRHKALDLRYALYTKRRVVL